MIDILYVLGGLGVGGTERQVSLILPALVQRGWNVEVALLGDEGVFSRPLHEAGIPVHRIETGPIPSIPKLRGLMRMRAQARALSVRLSAAPPTIVHCFLPTCCVVGDWAARQVQYAPIVMSRRSQSDRPSLHFGDKWLERRALRRASLVLGHSSWVLRELKDEGVAPERLRLVHNGVEIQPEFSAKERMSARASAGWRREEVVCLIVANLHPYKGHAYLMRGMAETMKAMPDWRLVFAGGGAADYTAQLSAMAAELGLVDRIEFLGQRNDVPRLLAGADIGILASDHEGFSNALLEYMAASLPVVATATGGNLDAVEEGRTGFLVPPASPIALGKAVAALVQDADLRGRFGVAGRRKIEAEFSLDACISGYENVYRSLLS